MDAQQQGFAVKYIDEGAGWIKIDIFDGLYHFVIDTSNCYDPFRGMLSWLEDIVHGAYSSEWDIDEEGLIVEVTYSYLSASGGKLHIDRRPLQDFHYTCRVEPRELVASLYQGFRQFVESEDYKQDDWEEQTIGEFLMKQLKMTEVNLRKQLARYPARAIQQLGWNINPRYELLCPEGMTERLGYSEYAHKPIKAVAHSLCIAIPVYPELPDEYDNVSQEIRNKLLDEFLQQVIKNEGSARLKVLRSQIIEDWLGLEDTKLSRPAPGK